MSITGSPDDEPMKVGVALVDVLTAKDAVIGILAALRARERIRAGPAGRGQPAVAACSGSLANQASAYLATGEAPARMGNQHPSIAPYETLRCAGRASSRSAAATTASSRGWPGARRPRGWPTTSASRPTPARVAHRAELVAELETPRSPPTPRLPGPSG